MGQLRSKDSALRVTQVYQRFGQGKEAVPCCAQEPRWLFTGRRRGIGDGNRILVDV